MAVDYIGDSEMAKIIYHLSASLRAGSDTANT